MKKTTVVVSFTLGGKDFDVDHVTQMLETQPTYCRTKNEVLGNGRLFGYTKWGTLTQREESTDVEIQVNKAIAPFLDKASLLNQLRLECEAEWQLTIVVYVEEDEPPFMGFTREQMRFLGSIEAEVDFDFYIMSDRRFIEKEMEMERIVNSNPENHR